VGTKRKRKKAFTGALVARGSDPILKMTDWPSCGVCDRPLNIEEDKPGSKIEDGILFYCWECECETVNVAGTYDISFLKMAHLNGTGTVRTTPPA